MEENTSRVSIYKISSFVTIGILTKTLYASINSKKASSVQAVNEKGQVVNLKNYTGKFYFKVTSGSTLTKGTKYNIEVNVILNGYKTFANILYPNGYSKQPLVSIRKELYNTGLSANASFKEELTGKYKFFSFLFSF